MIRRVIELTEEQAANLEQLADRRQVPVEQLISQVVESLLRVPAKAARPTEEQRRRAAALSGCFDFGVADLAENHDKYLAEAYQS